MRPLILLDIDGVLNPVVAHPNGGGDASELSLSDEKVSLVQRLARCGRIAWASTSPEDLTAELESQLQLEVEPLPWTWKCVRATLMSRHRSCGQ
ncbi:HAD domain-containing protein [Arthrobacter sp. D1-17]